MRRKLVQFGAIVVVHGPFRLHRVRKRGADDEARAGRRFRGNMIAHEAPKFMSNGPSRYGARNLQTAPNWPAERDYYLGFRDGFVDYIWAGGNGEPPQSRPGICGM